MTDAFSSSNPMSDDVAALQAMLAEREAAIAERDSALAERDSVIERLKHELMLLRQWRFGRKSEKFSPKGQPSLFPGYEPETVDVAAPEAKPARKGHGRKVIPASLPVERIEIEIPAGELVCQLCEADKIRIGEEIRRELDYTPGSIHVREYVRPAYACPNECEGQVVAAKNPASPIEKGLPGPGLLAYVATSKYADHLPLNRLEGILKRAGVDIRRSTMADWMAYAAHLLVCLVAEMKRLTLLSKVIHTDDTPVTVLDPKGKAKPHPGRIWIYSGDRHHPYDIQSAMVERLMSKDNESSQERTYRLYQSMTAVK